MNNLPENPDQTPEKKTSNREPAKYPTRIEMGTTIIVIIILLIITFVCLAFSRSILTLILGILAIVIFIIRRNRFNREHDPDSGRFYDPS